MMLWLLLWLNKLKGTARYAGLLLAPAEGLAFFFLTFSGLGLIGQV